MSNDKNLPEAAEKNSQKKEPSALSHPNTPQAAEGMEAIAKHFSRSLTATDMLDVLQSAMRRDSNGHGMMFTQMQVLDSLFHRLILNSMSGIDEDGEPIKNYVSEMNLNLALRTQKQCRTTLEALNTLKRAEEQKKKKEPDPWHR